MNPIFSSLLGSLFTDNLDLTPGDYIEFPNPRKQDAAGGRYQASFTTIGIRLQDVLL